MATLSQAFAIAVQHYQAGRLEPAEQVCRQILQAEPNHADTLNLQGVIAHHSGRYAVAAELLARAVSLEPSNAHYHSNRGLAFAGLGQLDEAVHSFLRALELQPDLDGTLVNLGQTLHRQAHFDQAADSFRQALQLRPESAEAWANLGHTLRLQGRLEESETCGRRAVRFNPKLAQSHHYLANALRGLGRFDEAVLAYHRALQLRPDVASIYDDLARAWLGQGRPQPAEAACRQTLKLQPDHAEAWVTLADALRAQYKFREAVPCYQRGLQLRPDQAGVHNNLANTFNDLDMPEEALAGYQQALRLAPDYAEAHSNQGSVLHRLAELDQALDCFQRALAINPRLNAVASNRICTLRYRAQTLPAELAAAEADYQRQHAAPLRATWREHKNVRQPDRLLRLGFVAPRFTRLPLGAFLLRALENLDRRQCQALCYSDSDQSDEATVRFQAAAQWRATSHRTDEQLAEQIRADEIDILFDLAGHSPRNRLLTFARKPAPVQITWIDSVGGTGLTAIDYLLADSFLVPRQAESHYAERVLRLPDGYVVFDPPAHAPPVAPLPARQRGQVTFGSFNNPAKLNGQVMRLWSRILCRVPGSRLVLKHNAIELPRCRWRLEQCFAECGVQTDRVEYRGPSRYADCLAEYGEIDVALDPAPHSGGLTTCDCLWMGVPVVTCPGPTFASRQTLGHLSNIGFTETIAGDFDEYVELAVRLANDLPRLADIRAMLRGQMAASPLCDGPRFAAHLVDRLQQAWGQWCRGPCPSY